MIKEFKYNKKKIRVEVILNDRFEGSIDTAEKHLITGTIDGREVYRRHYSDLQITLAPGLVEKELRKMVKSVAVHTTTTKQLKKLSDNGYK